MRVSTSVFIILGLTILFASPVSAIPNLQLYIEGATYDAGTETWVATGGDTVRLWCIGAVGEVGNILDVRLAVAYVPENGAVTVNLTPTQAGGTGSYSGVNDPSTPSAATYLRTVTDGSLPQLTDGSSLPAHGIYNQAGVEWQEFALGNFTLADSNIGDFISDFPTELNKTGQINVYEVAVSGVGEVHFELYDTVEGSNHAIFAPFSHDAGGGDTPPVPEPGTIALLGLGGLILAGGGLRRRKK